MLPGNTSPCSPRKGGVLHVALTWHLRPSQGVDPASPDFVPSEASHRNQMVGTFKSDTSKNG